MGLLILELTRCLRLTEPQRLALVGREQGLLVQLLILEDMEDGLLWLHLF